MGANTLSISSWKQPKKVTNRIKGQGGDGRVKIFHARLMLHIQRCFSCHDNTSGWINDPDLGGQVGAECIQLFLTSSRETLLLYKSEA